MVGAGISPKVVQQRLGHAHVSVTLQLYSHVLPSHGSRRGRRAADVPSIAAEWSQVGHENSRKTPASRVVSLSVVRREAAKHLVKGHFGGRADTLDYWQTSG